MDVDLILRRSRPKVPLCNLECKIIDLALKMMLLFRNDLVQVVNLYLLKSVIKYNASFSDTPFCGADDSKSCFCRMLSAFCTGGGHHQNFKVNSVSCRRFFLCFEVNSVSCRKFFLCKNNSGDGIHSY